MEKIINDLTTNLLDKIKEKVSLEITSKNIITILPYVMEAIETFKLIKDNKVNKKELCLEILKKITEMSPIGQDEKEVILKLLNSEIISTTIDLIVKASKGELIINKIVNEITETAIENGTEIINNTVNHIKEETTRIGTKTENEINNNCCFPLLHLSSNKNKKTETETL